MSTTRQALLGRLLVASWVLAASCGPPPEKHASTPAAAPASPAHEVAMDTYHGVEVRDPWRWLENGEDPAVRTWSREQNERARSYLDRLPGAAGVRKRLDELMMSGAPSWSDVRWAGGQLLALKSQPPREQRLLVALGSPDDLASERVVLDPNVMDSSGGTAIDFFVPSPDGKLVAVSLSKGGSESGDVHVYQVADGQALPDVVPRVNGGTAGGSVAWNGDASGFWYTRYPRPGERPDGDLAFFQQVWFHRLGDSGSGDRYEIGREFPRIAEIQLASSPDGRRVLANVQKGDGGEFTQHLRLSDGSWVQLTRAEDRCVHGALGGDGAVYLVSRLDAPRGRILRVPIGAAAPSLRDATVIVPEETDSVDTDFASASGLWTSRGLLFVRYQTGGPTAVKCFDFTGKPIGSLPSAGFATVGSVAPLGGDDVLYRQETYLTPPAWFAWSAADGSSRPTKLAEASPADHSDTEVVRESAVSKDGTPVPIFVVRRRGAKLDGSNPTLLSGYGGYGVSRTPTFRPRLRLWIEQGAVYAEANVRGGGEFGERVAPGREPRPQAERLRRLRGLRATPRRRRLHAAGAARDPGRQQRRPAHGRHDHPAPGARSARWSRSVGIYDMLRVELTPNGAFNVTEFGTVKDPDQFRALHAYSPYHHVTDGVALPGGPHAHGRERPARGPLAQPEDGGAPPGGDLVGPSDPPPHERIHRTRCRIAPGRARRGIHGCVLVPPGPAGRRVPRSRAGSPRGQARGRLPRPGDRSPMEVGRDSRERRKLVEAGRSGALHAGAGHRGKGRGRRGLQPRDGKLRPRGRPAPLPDARVHEGALSSGVPLRRLLERPPRSVDRPDSARPPRGHLRGRRHPDLLRHPLKRGQAPFSPWRA